MLYILTPIFCVALCVGTVFSFSKTDANAATAADLADSSKTLEIDELTLSGYDSSKSNAQVFNDNNLAKLYSALTGGNGSTLQAVKDSVTGSEVSYGNSTTTASGAVTIPAYKSAKDLYDMNENKNIVVNFGGQQWTVTFLTTDFNGDVIATLWLADCYKESGVYQRSPYGWYNTTSVLNGTATATNYVANMYSSSLIRVKTLNGGDVNGGETKYAHSTSATATTATLSQTVSASDRVANPWAIYTLNNTALGGSAKANKSLTDYIDTPSQLKYTYYEDFNYHYYVLGGNTKDSFVLNEAINKNIDDLIPGLATGANTILDTASSGSDAHNGYWYSSTIKNVAYTDYAEIGYNDWAHDYVWLPSRSEIGALTSGNYMGMPGIWQTAYSSTAQTGQLQTMSGNGTPVAWNGNQGTIDASECFWLRSGGAGTWGPINLASGGASHTALPARTLAVRPALHLNLSKADEASALNKPTENTSTFTYTGSEQTYLPKGFNSNLMNISGNVQTNAGDYTASVTPKAGYVWEDGSTDSVDFTFKINKAKPTVSATFPSERPFVTSGFPNPISYTATCNGTNITGTFEWINQNQLIEANKSKEYEWTFKPDPEYANNYKEITGKATFNFQERKIQSKTYAWKSEITEIYTKTSIGDLMDMITLEVLYNDSATPVYETNFNIESVNLVAGYGNSYVMVSFGGAPEKFMIPNTVEVIEAAVESLTVMFNQNGKVITVETPLEDLKQNFTVWVKWNYNVDQIKLDSADYTLSGMLAVNGSNVNVEYEGISEPVTGITVTKATYNMTAATAAATVAQEQVYNDSAQAFVFDDTKLPSGVTVDTITYTNTADNTSSTAAPTNAGTYTVTVSFNQANSSDYNKVTDITSKLTIKQAKVTGISFADEVKPEITGTTYTLEATGYPSWVSVEYYYNGSVFTGASAAGKYEITAKFTIDAEHAPNYEPIGEMTKTLTIVNAVLTKIEAKLEEGAVFTTVSTLDDLKAKLTVTAVYDNGSTHAVTEFTLTCETLREGGLLEVGKQTITVTYNDGAQDFTTTVEIEVAKAKVALPVYNGTLSYNGDEIKPTVADFEGFDSALMAFVEDKTVAGLNAGTYKAVFALTDTEHYEWATATTYKKALFKVALYDEITIDPTIERAVDWTLERAVITATIGADGKPVFKSDGISAAALAQAVGLKFFADEACTQEVAADALDYETSYYMQADLLDNTNFKLDNTVSEVLSVPYTTPAKELTFWEKVVKFLTSKQLGLFVWLWIVIAVVAFIILITIIACAARSAKKKREREEQRRLEEKEEKKREQEERRLEREERMARMSQQQAPQMMMPQMMPQMMGQMQAPQAAQGAVVSGASSNEIAELKAEMAAMKASQDMAKELAIRAEMTAREMALRAEQNAVMRSDINALRGGEQTSGIVGISLDKLTELVEKTVERVLERKEKPAAEKAEGSAAPVTAQVPPDAVMTTVTTTKIDTTKKPHNADRTAQPAPAGRTVVRNFVAPMPVDDGRVFDVGGFYTPADPVTDIDNPLGDDDKRE